MDFKDELNKLSEHINTYRDHLYSEEATKTSLVSPFFRLLGYDDSNPLEIKPELSCGKWFNKGKKVDYGIYHDGKLSIIVECKHSSETSLAAHFEQLDYYFHALEPKFAILTNGITYQFYTDIDKANKMDEIPFLEIDLSNVQGYQVAILEMFHKSCYDAETIWNYAKQHKELDVITAGVEEVIKRELYTPSEDLVRYFISKVYCGEISQSLLEHSTEVLKQTFVEFTHKEIIGSNSERGVISPCAESIVIDSNDTTKWNNVYKYVVSVHLGKTYINDAAERVHDLYNDVAPGSFIMYYYAYEKMLSGELHKRSISQSLLKVLLDGIYNDYGKDGLLRALKSYLLYIEHRKKKDGNPKGDECLYDKYMKVATK